MRYFNRYLVPLFTHRGRPLNEFCPSWCGKCISLCYKCKPDHDKVNIHHNLTGKLVVL